MRLDPKGSSRHLNKPCPYCNKAISGANHARHVKACKEKASVKYEKKPLLESLFDEDNDIDAISSEINHLS